MDAATTGHDGTLSGRRKGETAEVRKANYAESLAWYPAIIADTFSDTSFAKG